MLLVNTYYLETPFQPPSDVDMSKMDVEKKCQPVGTGVSCMILVQFLLPLSERSLAPEQFFSSMTCSQTAFLYIYIFHKNKIQAAILSCWKCSYLHWHKSYNIECKIWCITLASIIVVKSNSFVRFLEETSAWKNHFDLV